MSRKNSGEPTDGSLEDALDGALGDILGQGWDEPAEVEVRIRTSEEEVPSKPAKTGNPVMEGNQEVTPAKPEYPPLPVREGVEVYLEPQPHGGALMRQQAVEDEGDPKRPQRAVMDVGLLADLAAGRKTAVQAAQFAGVSVDEVQSSLALALREVPPEEIAKAMGLQAAEQQLKSGAIFGVILADLVADMAAGRLKPETKIELAKLLARVGRVEPKEDKGAGMGNGFVLNINLGAGREPVTIDAS